MCDHITEVTLQNGSLCQTKLQTLFTVILTGVKDIYMLLPYGC